MVGVVNAECENNERLVSMGMQYVVEWAVIESTAGKDVLIDVTSATLSFVSGPV